MNFLICSKISIPAINRTIPEWGYLDSLGHKLTVIYDGNIACDYVPDVIISMGVSVMEETFEALKRFPNAKLFCYNWDCYEWVWSNPRDNEYDYTKYGNLLRHATEVWVPSECTGIRTTQWWDIDNWKVIRSCCPTWEHDDIRDGGYVLCCLREIPDPNWGMFERACEEINQSGTKIKWMMTKHEESYEEYQNSVADCKFIVCPLYELSTGGLSLMEAYYHGKPVLINDSVWNGARDYFPATRATYFNGYEDFKDKLLSMYNDIHQVSWDHKQYITDNFSDKVMINQMLERIEANK